MDAWENFPDGLYHDWIKMRYVERMRFPLLWMVAAYRLKRAADTLLAVSKAASKAEMDRAFEEHKARKAGTPAPDALSDIEVINRITDMSQIDTYYMLTGLAIENAVKGILVVKNPTLVTDDGQFKISTHNLIHCLEKCSIAMSDIERNALTALQEYVVWAGRYPGPVKAFLPERDASGNFKATPMLSHRDHTVTDALFERVYELLAEVMALMKRRIQEGENSES